MYQVLYRKWRPRTFSEVYGQDTVTAALKNELQNNRLSHAYLFTGCRGTGKTTCAKILAKAVNCEHPVDGDPCNECAVCRGIDDGSVLDVVEIDAASNNGVDNIRDLREEVNFTPSVGKYRVYIIDEVHMLSAGAFNALLKTLEEPPAHVIFILATTEVHKLPATILSRCQRFDFGRIAPESIAARLRYVAEHEEFTITDEAALLLARLADGAMRDALSLLDQCVSRSKEITAATVAEATGMAGQESLRQLTGCIRSGDTGAALALIDRLYESSKDMERLCAEWVEYFRNLMILKSVNNAAELIVATPEDLDAMRAEADGMELPVILHAMTLLQTTLDRLRGGVSRRVEMETAVLKLCAPELDTTPDSLLRRIKALEDAMRAGVSAVPAAVPAPSTVPERETAVAAAPAEPEPSASPVPSAAADTMAAEAPFTRWGEVLEILKTTCIPLYGILADSAAVQKGNMTVICTDNELFKELYGQDDNKKLLAEAIRKVTGEAVRIGLRRTAPRSVEKANDPLSRLKDVSRGLGIPVTEK